MTKTKIFAVLLFGLAGACNLKVPTSLCDMPEGRQSWQNIKVNWTGTLIEISSSPHGGGIYFADPHCGRIVPVEIPKKPASYFPEHEPFGSYAAGATFSVTGKFNVRDNVIVLDISSAVRRSEWLDDIAVYQRLDAIHAAVDKRYGRQTPVSP